MPTRSLFVRTREGLSLAVLDSKLAERVEALGPDGHARARLLDFAALVVVRVGREAGEMLLAHWLNYDPALISGADPLLLETLAYAPEFLTGPLTHAASGLELNANGSSS